MAEMEQDLPRLEDGYRRAIERAFERVPVRNGVVSIRDLWLETSLPMDLIAELLQGNGVKIPPYVERVDLDQGRKRRKARHGRKR
jgi:hypothetical protein